MRDSAVGQGDGDLRPELAEIDGQHVFSIRELLPREHAAGRAAALVDEVRAALASAQVQPSGPPFARLTDPGAGTEVELEAGLPTVYTCGTAYTRLTEGILPGGPVVVCAGAAPLDQARRAWLARWLDEQGLDAAASPWLLLDGSGTAVWPVRTVRDTPAFISRHGPRAGLGRVRELYQRDREDIARLIDAISYRFLNLESAAREARALAGAA